MKRNVKRILAIFLSMIMAAAILTSCGKATPTQEPTTQAAASAQTTAPEQTADNKTVKLPLTTEPVTFKLFKYIDRAEQDWNKSAVWAKISELTGIKFEYTCLLSAAAAEQLKLAFASRQLPDIIFGSSTVAYPGGYEKAIDDGMYIDLKELLPKYAPLYWEKLNSRPEIMRDILTDKGYIGHIPGILEDVYIPNQFSFIYRADWLEELKLPVPKTIDELYTVLKAFKEQKKAAYPLTGLGQAAGINTQLLSAYGIYAPPATLNTANQVFYPDENGKIHYGGIEPKFQDYLLMASKWYKEGLLDKEFMTRQPYDLPGRANMFANGESGVCVGYLDWMGMFYGSAKDVKGFKLTSGPYPSLDGNKVNLYINGSKYIWNYPAHITTACKKPELAVQLFNFLTTEQGIMLTNYGIEGDDYKMVDGKPVYTDKILKSEFGAQPAMEIFTGNFATYRLAQTEYVQKQLVEPDVLAMKETAGKSANYIYSGFQLNADESKQLGNIMGDILTYASEEITKATMNPDIAAKWNDVQAKQIKSMGIEDAIKIVQGAYDRYMSKK